jgi:hypothetical protein
MKTALAVMPLLLSSTTLAVEEGRDSSESFLDDCLLAEKAMVGDLPKNQS